jgi:hypothetical protein
LTSFFDPKVGTRTPLFAVLLALDGLFGIPNVQYCFGSASSGRERAEDLHA